MNKFANLTKKLINNKLWKNEITLIQLEQDKNSKNKVIFIDSISKTLNCIKKDLDRKFELDKFNYYTEFFVSIKDLNDFNLKNNKFAIIYNDTRFIVEDVKFAGTINNEDSLVKFTVKR